MCNCRRVTEKATFRKGSKASFIQQNVSSLDNSRVGTRCSSNGVAFVTNKRHGRMLPDDRGSECKRWRIKVPGMAEATAYGDPR
jgi:hypothetical protein